MTPKETIKIGQLVLDFLLDGDDTHNRMVMFEMTIPPGAKVPVPHYHEEVDEALYGLEGILTSIVDGKEISTQPGDYCFIPRGIVHHHDNKGSVPAKTLCVLTPASIGPAYFREIAGAIQPGVPPNPAVLKEIMLRHGLIPAVG
jgi:quercetin dioxygenase-like cupin family protein